MSSGTDAPFAFIAGSSSLQSVSYYIQDPVGTVVGLVRSDSNSTQAVREQYSYYILGMPLMVIDSGLADRMQWKGMVYEGDSTRLYYARARWYDPQQGRFMSEDPLGAAGGLNQYVFGAGDAINGSDPSGQCDNQCYLTLFGTGVYGWDLSSGCLGCDHGDDPLSIAYGDAVPGDMANFNPYIFSSSSGCGAITDAALCLNIQKISLMLNVASINGTPNCGALGNAMDNVLEYNHVLFLGDNNGSFTFADGSPAGCRQGQRGQLHRRRHAIAY